MKRILTTLLALALIGGASSPTYASDFYKSRSGAVKVYVIDGGYISNTKFTVSQSEDFTRDKGTSLDGLDCEREHGGYHGNKTAGLIAKYASDAKIDLVSLKAFPCSSDFRNSYWSIYNALNWVAANHPKEQPGVVNLSATVGRYGMMLEIPLRKLEKLGIPVIVSSGNYGGDACSHYTAKSKRTIAIGGLDKNFTGVWDKSNTGKCVDYYAASFHTCVEENDTLARCNGTSFATPVVSARIASFLYNNPSANISDVKSFLEQNAKSKTLNIKGKPESIKYLATPRKKR